MSFFSDSDHRRLEAVVFPDNCIVESHQISDALRGLRRVPVTKVWRTERILGRGSFGEVHLQSQDNDKDAKRALKVIRTSGTKMSLADCQRELTAMIEFTKPKYKDAAVFVDFIGWFQNDNAMYLAMEFMPLGDLEHNVKEIENSSAQIESPLSEEEVKEITRQILEGLKIMHTEGFAHRDLKPQNIFVVQRQPQWWVKLGDFGLSKKLADGTVYRTHAGTQQYMAPELFYYVQELDPNTSEYTNAIDLWSLGCIIHRLVTRGVPFPSLLSLKNYCKDPSKMPLNMPPSMDEARKFVQDLLLPNPSKRPRASEALEFSWLTSKNQPKIILNDMATNSATSKTSRTDHGYNTTSHKGLQTMNNLPTRNNPASTSSLHRPGSEPLPLPTIVPILGSSVPAPQLSLRSENSPSSIQVADGDSNVKDWSVPLDVTSDEWSKLTLLYKSGKTAPRLIQDLLDYDPRWHWPSGENLLADPAIRYRADDSHPYPPPRRSHTDCKHELWRKQGQTFLPATDEKPSTGSKYVSASYCILCLYHFEVILDLTRRPGREIPCKLGTQFPLHHFQHRRKQDATTQGNERYRDKYYSFKEIHTFSCSAESCPAMLDIRIYPPRLSEELLSPILDEGKVSRRGQKWIKKQPGRYSDYRPLKPPEVLHILRVYLYDALRQGADRQRRTYVGNKMFRLGFADECDALFEYLDFGFQVENSAQILANFLVSYTGDQDQYWLLPSLEPRNDNRFAMWPKRKFIEDAFFEISARIKHASAQHVLEPPVFNIHTQVGVTLEPASEDLYRILGCFAYPKIPISTSDIEEREQEDACYEDLGAVNDFSDGLLTFAYRRQRGCDPENGPYYLECLQKIATGRGIFFIQD